MPSSLTPAADLPDDYGAVLAAVKQNIKDAQVRAHRVVNKELVKLYWTIGKTILDRQGHEGWGAKVIDRLSADLRHEFPDSKGYSRSNLEYMRRLAAAWPTFPQQAVGEMPWGHLTVLLDRLDDQETRDWYAAEAVRNGWSRSVLLNQIKSQLHLRAGAAPTNFGTTLVSPDSELVHQLVKDPYNFEFLGISGEVAEHTLERALIDQLEGFLLELGHGFAFMGRQYHLDVDGEDFYIDLLFYNVPLHRYVVFELKIDKFTPAHAGQLGFYVAVVDDKLAGPEDNPTIGILLWASKNESVVSYALSGSTAPMAVAGYDLLPTDVQAALPAAAELEEAIAHPVVGGEQLTISEYLERLETGQDTEGRARSQNGPRDES